MDHMLAGVSMPGSEGVDVPDELLHIDELLGDECSGGGTTAP